MNTIYPQMIIDDLLDWCADNAAADPRSVVIIGLSYGYALSRAQIVHTKRQSARDIVLEFPLARGSAAIRGSDCGSVTVTAPDWLAVAIASLTSGEHAELLLRPLRLGAATVSVTWVSHRLQRVSVEATGYELSAERLCKTGMMRAYDLGFLTAAVGVGYSATSENILPFYPRQLVLPFRP